MAAAVMFGAVACSQYDEQEVVEGQEVTTTFAIGLEDLGTRVAGDSGMIDKVAWGIYDHQADGKGRFLAAHSSYNSEPADFDGEKAEIKVTLFTGKKYDLVFFGYCSANNAYSIDWEARELNVNYAGQKANVEANDAFFHIENGFTAGTNKTFTLRRPFAQLNVGQSMEDYDAMQLTQNYIEKSSVTAKAYTTMNLIDASVSNLVDVELTVNNVLTDNLEVNSVGYKHIAMNYLLVNAKEVVNEVAFKFVENGPTYTEFERTYYNVPLQRNYRTNILGRIISDEFDFEIVIDARFNEDLEHNILFLDEPVEANSDEDLLYYMKHYVVGEVNVDSDASIPAGTVEFIEMGDGTNATFNMNGAEINSGTQYDYGFIVRGDAKVVINDGNLKSAGGGFAVADGAKVEFGGDVYVSTASTSGRYLFYTEGAGSELTINDGNYSWSASDNQKRAYVYAGAGTTVYIKGGNFGKASTRSGYTAGILGPGTVIITGGTFGFNPSTWVAPGYKVVKVGSKWHVVTENTVFVNDSASLASAIENAADGATIVLTAGTYEGLFNLTHKDITLLSTEGAVIKGMLWLDTCSPVIKGLTLTNPNGVQHPNTSNSQYYASINNQYPLVGAYNNSNPRFENCVFNIVAPTVYGYYGYALNNPVFEGCTFNCNGIRPIASNGASMTVNGCTFVDQYHYSVRIFENSGALQTVVYTNNTVQGTNAKGEFEGINISKKGSSAVVLGNFTIKGNTNTLKYRHHKNVTMSDACSYDTDIANFAFEKED